MKEKTILTDVDGVLTNWSDSFCEWMISEGYTATEGVGDTYSLCEWFGIEKDEKMMKVRQFNDSHRIENLPPLRDAVEFVQRIHKHGYKFFVISSMSENIIARERRIKNLKQTFGDVFNGFIFLDTGSDKDDVLEQFRDSGYYWIEDKVENAQAGLDVGLKSVIMEHGFNMHSNIAPKVKNWEQFYREFIADY